jgi:hypothetical protein
MFIVQVFFTVITVLLALFNFWKKLKEDYTQNQIFTTGFYILLGIGVSNIIAVNFLPMWWFWLCLGGGISGLAIGKFRFSLRILEALDAFVVAGLFLLSGSFLTSWYFGENSLFLIGFTICILLIGLYKYLDGHYKRFTWYKSGRVGFSGLAVSGVFFLLRSLIALGSPNMLSFVGSSDIFLSGILAFVSFFALFNLSRK